MILDSVGDKSELMAINIIWFVGAVDGSFVHVCGSGGGYGAAGCDKTVQ